MRVKINRRVVSVEACNKSVFQKMPSSKQMHVSEVREYLDMSSVMTKEKRIKFIEDDCGIDYINANKYIETIVHFNQC